VLARCGWPKGIRPYNLRHATALTIRKRGGELADVQDALGHADMATTRIYADKVDERLQDVSARLEGRFGWTRRATQPAPEGANDARMVPSVARSTRARK
jgi:hypothetical protein